MSALDHLLGCRSCGPVGRLRRRRARRASEIADAAHSAFFTRLGAEVRAERTAERRTRVRAIGQAYITIVPIFDGAPVAARRPMLTTDQRHVLAAYNPGLISALIVAPEYGLNRIKSTWAGGSASRNPDAPDWLRWVATSGGSISGGPTGGGAHTVIGYATLAKWAATVPADLRQELADNRDAATAERVRTYGWCHCPYAETPPNAHSGPCTRYHPTDDEDDDHLALTRQLWDAEKALVRQAIWADTEQQLDLFEVD